MTEEEAKNWAKDKANQEKFLTAFFKDYSPHKKKLAFFMVGIAVAGKTEFAVNTCNIVMPRLVSI